MRNAVGLDISQNTFDAAAIVNGQYKQALFDSPQMELNALLNAMSGGYTKPSPGGDPIVNPNTLPTGRNLFGINAENTPSESAWEKGKELAENTISLYRKRHKGEYPRKVSYTLWSGELIETECATIAQVLYMLGVEPIRDSFGRVTDLRLIPSRQLGRPRIDVVVQTSGQLRDLAASRLFLINRAVEMAAAAKDEAYTNQVAAGVVEAERTLTKKGVSPKAARAMATRFCIPPEISDGSLFSAFTKFTRLSTVLARSRISSGVCLENIFRGNITFSSTVIESKRALPWNTIPIFWRRATCSLRFISAYFTPS